MTKSIITIGRSRPSRFVQWCVLLMIVALLIETLLIGGLAMPYRIAGDSMAGALLGSHRNVTCGDCGYRFSCGTDVFPAAVRAICPNCGHTVDNLKSLPEVSADRVLIDRVVFSIRAPRRWEIAAFRRPPRADRLLVKRIVGLPGESIELRDGDVYADGEVQRKNLLQQRALAVLVHDADFCPTRDSTVLPRWRPQRSDSRWNATAGCFSIGITHADRADGEPIDWLVYHHDRESPVTDVCGYNPSQPRREDEIHVVADLMLSFRLGHLSGKGSFFIRIADGHDVFEVKLHVEDQQPNAGAFLDCTTSCKQAVAHCRVPVGDGEQLVEVSLFDRQFLLAVDGRTLLAWPLEQSEPPTKNPPSSPLAIGVQGLEATVSSLRVYRDVYYAYPLCPWRSRLVRLAADEYYVLGDNSPVSEDSRTWPEPVAIDAKLLIGKPLVAIPSISLPLGGQSYFQVPNPTGIRYIR